MKNLMKLTKNKDTSKGITLIALVITIIILLILATVSIATLTGENGILTKAQNAKKDTLKSQALEELKIKILAIQTDKEGNTNLEDVKKSFSLDKEITIDSTHSSPTELYVTYKNYGFKIDNQLSITFTDEYSDNDNSETPSIPTTSRYLLIEVNGYFEGGDGAVLNELAIYNKNNEKINYTILKDLVFDSTTNEKPEYWESTQYWNYQCLNDNSYSYTSNTVGYQNCTLFLFSSSKPNSWARFMIDLGKEVEIGQIRVAVGGYDDKSPIYNRTPKEVSVYHVNDFIDGVDENSTYAKNIKTNNNDDLTLIGKKTFNNLFLQTNWVNLLIDNSTEKLATARYLIFEVNGYFENGDGAVLNELTLYDGYNEKINYTVLKDLVFDSTTNGKPEYWELQWWNYQCLNNNSYSYTSNTDGNKNCTLFLSSTSSEPDSWARFMIDLGEEVEIGQIKIAVGGYDDKSPIYNRTPKEISAYCVNNFTDGLAENTTYSQNIANKNNDNLTFIGKRTFVTPLSPAEEFYITRP